VRLVLSSRWIPPGRDPERPDHHRRKTGTSGIFEVREVDDEDNYRAWSG
jgi:hypothetical protein